MANLMHEAWGLETCCQSCIAGTAQSRMHDIANLPWTVVMHHLREDAAQGGTQCSWVA